MSSKSYFYNKHVNRSRSYYGKKRIYGSAYQPGQTTKYQRYGRTMRLDPSYISIPRELPTRQSQLRQLEELRKAGLIPDPVPPPGPVPVNYNYVADAFYFHNHPISLGGLVYNRCDAMGYNPGNLIGVSFSGKIHYNPSTPGGYYGITEVFRLFTSSYASRSVYLPFIFKSTSTTAFDILYTIVFMNAEIVPASDSFEIKSPKVKIIIQASPGSGQTYVLKDSNNKLIPGNISSGVSNSNGWSLISSKSIYSIETPDPTEEVPYYYSELGYDISGGTVATSSDVIPYNHESWNTYSVISNLWTNLSQSEVTYNNSTINNGIILEFAVPEE